ncbi:CDP-alcohol phosphatidyltransferase family protein [Arsenicicoccus sp. oral taxon 190]|uniref:CDP-alcohol phosphatidyltransferase family protein n=1 Tax=Arsenicicoccus sp. oral taxon 190 TaxID=1658671 RepID=UPI00067A396F|nr:CDP-alcohol phosphatidyltransferase family protein [Arsenicicoccus sp. oral taxon 190]AKT51844.1 hypothetical protein ADJ73_12190 [Arsenicicoccus sp. oral taxon 190]
MGERRAEDRVRPPVSDRVLTTPNALTVTRILLVPVFLWLLLGRRDELAAFWVLAASAATDWLDGAMARRFGLVSRLGQLLDPVADRLFVLSTLAGLLLAGIVPWWFVVALLARDFWGVTELLRLRGRGLRRLPVTFVGKAATFCLLSAFPLLLLGHAVSGLAAGIVRSVGWAFGWWGLGLYWVSAIMYYVQAQQVVRQDPR